MGDKYLSEVLDYDRDIKPYFFIQIYAGVGSGKSTFVESLAKRKIDDHDACVLYITSRRAKVDETFQYYENCDEINGALFARNIGYMSPFLMDKYNLDPLNCNQQSVVCTNAFIEYYLKNTYDPGVVESYLIEAFDYIVVDEVHSLFVDATYQSAPFFVNDLIDDCLNIYEELHCGENKDLYDTSEIRCKHLIIMTGTPDALGEYYKIDKNYAHSIDLMDVCKNVTPQKVYFCEAKETDRLIKQMVEKSNRIVYFTNHIVFPETFSSKTGISKSEIACSFSKKERVNHFSCGIGHATL